jgi:hypothetical protein
MELIEVEVEPAPLVVADDGREKPILCTGDIGVIEGTS